MKRKTVIAAISIVVFITCLVLLANQLSQSLANRRISQDLIEMKRLHGNADAQNDAAAQKQMMPQLAPLFEKNNDLAGWLTIPDTNINYAVVQGSDNEYYLGHDFYGNKNVNGSLFIDAACDLNRRSTNILIYGHNMKDGSMFADLKKYRSKAFYEGHSVIRFDTLYEEGRYEIIAVILSKVYYKQDDVFKYYQYTGIDSKEAFDEYVENVTAMSLYDTGKTAQYGDTLITLSTCDYSQENGRLGIIAKKNRRLT